MNPLTIATITTEPDPMRDYLTRWVISLSYPGRDDDPWLTFRTGNADEAETESVHELARAFGYRPDEVEIRHNY